MSCSQFYSIISLHVIQDLDQTGLVFGNDAEKLFAATMHQLIGRKGIAEGYLLSKQQPSRQLLLYVQLNAQKMRTMHNTEQPQRDVATVLSWSALQNVARSKQR